MNGPDPVEFGWWLASRAAGIVALLCIAISVGIGLAMAGRASRRAELARTLLGLHQQTALIGLVAIAVQASRFSETGSCRPRSATSRCPSRAPTSRCGPAWA
jgi:hypothetical protein